MDLLVPAITGQTILETCPEDGPDAPALSKTLVDNNIHNVMMGRDVRVQRDHQRDPRHVMCHSTF
jgi:hypothetical protein